jgi:hypothetical protein
MSITVIYGGPATGKTRYKDELARAYGARRIRDGWCPFDPWKPRDGDLLLTNVSPPYVSLPPHTAVAIAAALRNIGK